MPEITEFKHRELLKKFAHFIKIKSELDSIQIQNQEIIINNYIKEEAKKKYQHEVSLKESTRKNQGKLAQLNKEEETEKQKDQELVKQIIQSTVVHSVVVVKATDNTQENISYLLILAPEDQEKTIETIHTAYLDVTEQSPQSNNYENIEEFSKDQPNINLPENIRVPFIQGQIQLQVHILTFTYNQFKLFSSKAEIQTLIHEKGIHLKNVPLVDEEETRQENQIFRQFVFFPQPVFNLNKNPKVDNQKNPQQYFNSRGF